MKRRFDSKQARRLRRVLAATMFLTAAAGAAAATAATSMLVSVAVEPACTVSANGLNFGSYTPGRGGISASTTLAVRCTRGVAFTVALDAGSGGTSVTQRQMTFGAYRLQYNLYTSALRTTVWGDGTTSSAVVAGVGKGLATDTAITETVYGQLSDSSSNQALPPGVYTDTIRVTVAY
jgi:spore coat protein U-like protein